METLALEAALLAALPLVDLADTLLVLTADHSHVLTLGGLATPRGNPILGKQSIICINVPKNIITFNHRRLI